MRKLMKKATLWLLVAAMVISLLPAMTLNISADTENPHTIKVASTYPAETAKYAEYQLGTRSGSKLFTDLEDAANAYSYIYYFTDDDTAVTFSKAMQGHNFVPEQCWDDENPGKRTNRFYFKNQAFLGYAPQVAKNRFDFNNVTFDYTYDSQEGSAVYYKHGNEIVSNKMFDGLNNSVTENDPEVRSGGLYQVTTSDTVSCLYTNTGFINRNGESIPVAIMMDFTPTEITNNDTWTANYGIYSPAIWSLCYTLTNYVDVYDVNVTFLNQNEVAAALQSLAQGGSGSYGELMTHQIEVKGTSIFFDIDGMQGFEFKDGFDGLNFHRNANGDSDIDRNVRQRYPDYNYQFLHYTATGTENSLGYVHATDNVAYETTVEIDRGLYTSMIATFNGSRAKYSVTMFHMNGRYSDYNDKVDSYALPFFDVYDGVYHSGNTSANGGRTPYYTEYQSLIQNSPDGADMTSSFVTNPCYGNYNDTNSNGGVGWRSMPWTPEPEITKKVSFAAPSASAMPGASELYDSLAMTNAEADTDDFYYYIDVDVPAIGSATPYTALSVTDNLDNMVVRTSDIMVFKRPTDSNTWSDCTSEWTASAGQANAAYTPYTYTALNTASSDFYYHVYRIVLKCSFNSSYLSDPSAVVANGIAETQLSTGTTRQAAHASKTTPAAETVKVETADAAQTAEKRPEIKDIPETVEILETKEQQKKLEVTDLAHAATGESAQAIGNSPVEKAQANTTITYQGNGGKTSGNATYYTDTHPAGTANVRLKDDQFSRSGYRFIGWATSANATSITYSRWKSITWPSSNTTLYAIWEPESTAYELVFWGNGTNQFPSGYVTDTYNQYCRYNMVTHLSDMYFQPPTNCTFLGWNAYRRDDGKWLYTKDGTDKTGWYLPGQQPAGYFLYMYSDEQAISALGNPGQRIDMYAVWARQGDTSTNRGTIWYDGNGGFGTMTDQVVSAAKSVTTISATLKNNAFTRPGWTFLGWTHMTRGTGMWYHTTSDSYGNTNGTAALILSNQQYYSVRRNGGSINVGNGGFHFLYAQWAKVCYPQFPNVVSSGTALKDIPINGRVVANRPTGTAGILSGVTVTITNSSGTTVFSNSATIAATAASYNLPNLFSGKTNVLADGTYTVKVSVKTKLYSPADEYTTEIYSHTFTVGKTYDTEPTGGEAVLLNNDPSQRNYNQDAAIKPAGTFMMFRANGDAANAGSSLTGTNAVLDTTPEYCFNQTFRFVLEGEGTISNPYYYEIINTETGAYLTDNGKGNAVTFTLPTRSTNNAAQQWHLYQKDGANNTYYLYSGMNNYLTASSAGSATTGADEIGWVLRGVTMTVNEAVANYSIGGTNLSRESNAVNVRLSFPVTYEFDSTSAQVALPEELNDYLPDNVDYLFYGESTDVTTDLTNGTKNVSVGDTVVDSNGLTWIYDVRDHTGGDTSAAYDNAAGKAEIVTDGTGWKLTDGAADVSSAAANSTVTTTVKIADSTAELTSYWTPYARVFYEWDEDSPVPVDADALIAAANNGETAIADTPLVQIGKPGNDINDAVTSSDGEYLFLGWYPSNDDDPVTGKTISEITEEGTATEVDPTTEVTKKRFTMPQNDVYLEGLWVKMAMLANGQYGVEDYILYDYSQEITYIPENFDRSVFSAVKKAGSTAVSMKKDTDYNDSDLLTDCEISATNIAETNGKITLSLADGATAKDTDVLKYSTDIAFLNDTYCGRTIERTFPDGYTVYLVPASNVHYEESFLTYTGTWTDVSDSGTGVDDQEGLHPIHGYDAAYAAKTDANSNNAAKVTTVSAADNNHKASFTFTGNGFDIISRCSEDSGTMLVYVYNQSNQMVETVLCDCWLDTTNESVYYQIPVVHKTDYPYGTYRVEIYAFYNALFDHNSKATRSVVTETKVRQLLNLPKSVPLSIERACSTDLSGFKAESKAVRSASSVGSYKIYIDGIRVYNPLGYTDTVNGPLNESSDGFNVAAAYLYGKENELNPDYVQVRKAIVTGEETDDSGELDSNKVLYIASKGSFGLDADYTSGAVYLSTSGTQLAYHTDTTAVVVGTSSYYALLSDDDNSPLFYNADQATVSKNGTYQLYSKAGDSKNLYWYDSSEMHKIDGYGTMLFTDGKVDIQGPENEMYLQSGTAIGFIVEDYDADKIVHLSMKSPSGAPVTVYINGQANALTVKSRTEIYYDISAYVTDGTVVITTDAAGGNVLSVCNIKVTGRLLSVENRKTVRACPMATAYDTMLGIETEPDEQPTESENFGITSAYLRLNQDINVIYTAKLPENSENPYMIFTMNNIERKVTEYTVNDQGEYCFAFEGVTPQCMGDNICATLYATVNGTECSDTHSHYSVRTYCENTLARYAEDTKTVTLLSDLLTYGSAAQTYTSYKTETLVSDGLALNPSAYHEISGYGVSFSGEDADKACWCAASLTLSNNLAVNMIFAADSVENLTIHVTVNGRTEIFAEEDFEDLGEGKFSISFRGILATEFDDVISASFYVGENQIGRTLNYSVNTYICGTQACGNANLEAIVKALYNYGASAKAYSEKAE